MDALVTVDDYLAFCIERNEEPERSYSGTFTIRVPPELHRDAALQARLRNKSLNSWVAALLAEAATERRGAATAKVANVSQSTATPLQMGESEAETIVAGEKGP